MENNIFPIHVCFSSDQRYTNILIVALQSLINNTSEFNKYYIHILSDGIEKQYKSLIYGMCTKNITINIIEMDTYKEKLKNVFVDRHLSIATYYRFFLPELFKDINKILYLDTDILIMDDIEKIYNVDISEKYMAGCNDIAFNTLNFEDFQNAHVLLKKLGYIDRKKYVNAGILLFNLKKMRETNASKRLLDMALSHKFPFHDQDVLNLIFQDGIQEMDERWNFITHLSPEVYSSAVQKRLYNRIASNSMSIIHYAGARKPWNDFNILLGGLWWKTALNSPASAYFIKEIMTAQNVQHSKQISLKLKIKREFYRVMRNITFGKLRNFYNKKLKKYEN